jgi:dihydrofolate reductase
MRKLNVLTFISLDGVLQAPGGPDEDTSGGFKYGGWTYPYFDDFSGKLMAKQMNAPSELLLGRKTFEIFASYWPEHESEWPGINSKTKFAVSKNMKSSKWSNSVFLKNIAEIKKIKESNGPDLQVYGSGDLIQSLLKNDLVDEFRLKIFPVTLGKGKKLFDKGTMPVSLELIHSEVTPSGVIFADYKRSGKIKTGSFS